MFAPSRTVSIAIAGIALAFAPGAQASPPSASEAPLSATLQCDRAASPGRVKCSIEAHASGDRTLAWADVVLVELPPFSSALKGRIGPADATGRNAASERWAFGLVAKRAGEGDATARVRAVVCTGEAPTAVCMPVEIEVRAVVHVG